MGPVERSSVPISSPTGSVPAAIIGDGMETVEATRGGADDGPFVVVHVVAERPDPRPRRTGEHRHGRARRQAAQVGGEGVDAADRDGQQAMTPSLDSLSVPAAPSPGTRTRSAPNRVAMSRRPPIGSTAATFSTPRFSARPTWISPSGPHRR